MKNIKIACSALAVGVVLTACGGGYDRDEAIDDLVEEGIDEAVATCVVDIVEDEIGEDRLGSDDEPTDEEMQIFTDAALECMSASDG